MSKSRGAYYNDIDPENVAILRDLIKRGMIPDGEVDGRSIEDVRPDDLAGFRQCHFFAGSGGWPLALRLAGIRDDSNVWTGSPPCQPFSPAGLGLGFADARHLAPAFCWLIAQCRPAIVFGEQVDGAIGKGWLDRVAGDLESSGYAFGAAVLQASSVDAWHKRNRLWFGADTFGDEQPWEEPRCGEAGRMGRVEQSISWDTPWEVALAQFRVLDHALPRCVAATDAARNAIVPEVAAAFASAYLGARAGHFELRAAA